jgi:hypothetical protein
VNGSSSARGSLRLVASPGLTWVGIMARSGTPLSIQAREPGVSRRAILPTGHRQYCPPIVGTADPSSAIGASEWSPCGRFRRRLANRLSSACEAACEGWQENRSEGAACVPALFANAFAPEGDSAGDGPAPSDDAPVSAMGRAPGPARSALPPGGGLAAVGVDDAGAAPTAAHSRGGRPLPRPRRATAPGRRGGPRDPATLRRAWLPGHAGLARSRSPPT